jgi:hypothetical protein
MIARLIVAKPFISGICTHGPKYCSELGWDLSQRALAVLVCNFQGTDSNGLQPAQQPLDFAFFAFDSPFIGELSA